MTTQPTVIVKTILTKSMKIVDRITTIQETHPWLLEKEARHLLVCGYAGLANGYGYTGEELQDKMDQYVETICLDKRSNLMKLLRDTGGLA